MARLFALLLITHSFSHLNPSFTPGNHQWRGAASLFNRRGVQIFIGVHGFLSNVNRSYVNVFITVMNISVAEASSCTVKLVRLSCCTGFWRWTLEG